MKEDLIWAACLMASVVATGAIDRAHYGSCLTDQQVANYMFNDMEIYDGGQKIKRPPPPLEAPEAVQEQVRQRLADAKVQDARRKRQAPKGD